MTYPEVQHEITESFFPEFLLHDPLAAFRLRGIVDTESEVDSDRPGDGRIPEAEAGSHRDFARLELSRPCPDISKVKEEYEREAIKFDEAEPTRTPENVPPVFDASFQHRVSPLEREF